MQCLEPESIQEALDLIKAKNVSPEELKAVEGIINQYNMSIKCKRKFRLDEVIWKLTQRLQLHGRNQEAMSISDAGRKYGLELEEILRIKHGVRC
jgi:hypothetical protein